MPPFRLRILRILYFQPTDAVAFIYAAFALRHNSFQIVGADFLKKDFAIAIDVLRIDDSLRLVSIDQFPQALLSVDKWKIAEILVIEP